MLAYTTSFPGSAWERAVLQGFRLLWVRIPILTSHVRIGILTYSIEEQVEALHDLVPRRSLGTRLPKGSRHSGHLASGHYFPDMR